MGTAYSESKRVKKERLTNTNQFFWHWIASPTSGKDLFIISGNTYEVNKLHGRKYETGLYLGWEVIHDERPWDKMYFRKLDEELIGYEVDFIDFPEIKNNKDYKKEMIRTLF
jgi:hypothetical protein